MDCRQIGGRGFKLNCSVIKKIMLSILDCFILNESMYVKSVFTKKSLIILIFINQLQVFQLNMFSNF